MDDEDHPEEWVTYVYRPCQSCEKLYLTELFDNLEKQCNICIYCRVEKQCEEISSWFGDK